MHVTCRIYAYYQVEARSGFMVCHKLMGFHNSMENHNSKDYLEVMEILTSKGLNFLKKQVYHNGYQSCNTNQCKNISIVFNVAHKNTILFEYQLTFAAFFVNKWNTTILISSALFECWLNPKWQKSKIGDRQVKWWYKS